MMKAPFFIPGTITTQLALFIRDVRQHALKILGVRVIRSDQVGVVVAAVLALPFALGVDPATGKRYFWEIMIPGSIVGLIVGYATQKFGEPAPQRG